MFHPDRPTVSLTLLKAVSEQTGKVEMEVIALTRTTFTAATGENKL